MRGLCLAMAAGVSWMAGTCSAAAQAVSAPEEKRMHVESTFEVMVHAPYEETAALFGPEGERAWAGEHWDPQFLYPVPARDKQGAVFTISHGGMNAVWVTAQHDLEARHFQYVYFIADVMVTTIDVRFRSVDSRMTAATVTYARTSLSPQGDLHVQAMSDGDRTVGKEWQKAIDGYLASRPAR